MLVEFSVTNFRSIAATQSLSLVAGKEASNLPQYSIKTEHSYAPAVLRSIGIFGPNGAGKSAVVKAMKFFQKVVTNSHKDEGVIIDVEPHVYDKEWRDSPSSFEIVFLSDGRLFQYGFSTGKSRIFDEWLYVKEAGPSSRMKTVFVRSFNQDNENYDWTVSRSYLSKDRDVWQRSTRDNALYLSTAVSLNSKELKEVSDYISKRFKIIGDPRRLGKNFTVEKVVEEPKDWKKDILSFLSDVDISIEDIKAETADFDPSVDFPDDMPDELKISLSDKIKDTKVLRQFDTVRRDKDGVETLLAFDEESSGSQVLFALAGPILHVLRKGYTLIIDEMNSTLHPLAVRYLVSLFNDDRVNQMGAQLIFTGHETSVMERNLMHSDQVWTVEKEADLTTVISPVSRFKSRDLVNLRKSYMTGRIGGIPLITGNDFSTFGGNDEKN
jgi:uncharacterized protein